MDTPLYSTLKKLADTKPLRLHMPGHKGKLDELSSAFLNVDFTELDVTGNLYEGGVPFDKAQELWANQFGFENCQFLTGGATQGLYTALSLATKPKDKILVDRGSHRAVYHGIGLLDLTPVYLQRSWLSDVEISSVITPEQVEQQLKLNPDIKAVCITSPTYSGLLSDIHSIAQVVHSHNAILIVDGAHGAHLPWLMIDQYSSADLVAISPHKTLPTLGQSAILLYRDFAPEIVREKASIFGSSSPSYAMLASMDLARGWMDEEGMIELVRVAREVTTLREIFPSLCDPLPLDPTRLTILCPHGDKVAKELEKQGIYLEMATPAHLVSIFSGMDTDFEVQKFGQSLLHYFDHREKLPDLTPPTVLPRQERSIHQVIHGKKKLISIKDAQGKIAGETIAPYPPGIPVVAMGEEISEIELSYLNKLGYHKESVLVLAE